MKKIGVACGRFQIFHNEHLQYVLAAKEKCDYLIVGITSPNGVGKKMEGAADNREDAVANPCTYYERMCMVREALLGEGLKLEEFDIVPYPIEAPELIHCYVPEGATTYITVLDQWGDKKKERIESAGYPVEILWDDKPKGVSSTMLREYICSGKEWLQYVPKGTYNYIVGEKIDNRIKEMMEKERK